MENKPTFSLNALALLLTILDKERHNAVYFTRVRDDSNEYLDHVSQLLELFSNQLDAEYRDEFIGANPHLEYLFTDDEELPFIVPAKGASIS